MLLKEMSYLLFGAGAPKLPASEICRASCLFYLAQYNTSPHGSGLLRTGSFSIGCYQDNNLASYKFYSQLHNDITSLVVFMAILYDRTEFRRDA